MHPAGSLAPIAEQLEARTLLSEVPYQISTVSTGIGTKLVVVGTSGADTILVNKASNGILVTDQHNDRSLVVGSFAAIEVHGGAGNDNIRISSTITTPTWLYGESGADTLVGGSGADTIFAGKNGGYLNGYGGNDTLVVLNTTVNPTVYGGAGTDNFWFNRSTQTVRDLTTTESGRGGLHRIGSFVQGATVSSTTSPLTGQPRVSLSEPIVTSSSYRYQSFSNRPLFGTSGPLKSDVYQGYVGDCYFVATLSAIAKTDPADIRKSITELGDGTYAVQFHRGTKSVYVRVDADLPTSSGTLAYARLGSNGSLWVALMEKAFTYFRYGDGKYASISGGWMSEAFAAMGATSSTLSGFTNGTSMLRAVQSLLSQGKAVTYAVFNAGSAPLISQHAYTVDGVIYNSSGVPVSLRLRNPWGFDGAGHDSNTADGYVTVTAAQAYSALWAIQSAVV